MKFHSLILFSFLVLVLASCENRDINEGEEFRPREVNEDFDKFHFNKITYDGIDYLITERDNNNPHEGFGFMAFRPNLLFDMQDSILAHLKTQADIQTRMYAGMFNLSQQESDSVYNQIFYYYLDQAQLNRVRFIEPDSIQVDQ